MRALAATSPSSTCGEAAASAQVSEFGKVHEGECTARLGVTEAGRRGILCMVGRAEAPHGFKGERVGY